MNKTPRLPTTQNLLKREIFFERIIYPILLDLPEHLVNCGLWNLPARRAAQIASEPTGGIAAVTGDRAS